MSSTRDQRINIPCTSAEMSKQTAEKLASLSQNVETKQNKIKQKYSSIIFYPGMVYP